MAAEFSTTTTLKPHILLQTLTSPKTTSTQLFFNPLRGFPHSKISQTQTRTKKRFTVCVITENPKNSIQIKTEEKSEPPINKPDPHFLVAQKLARKESQRLTYLVAAIMSSSGVTSMAILAVYYRFSWQMEGSGEVPWAELFGTFALSVGAASHHRPREGPFELNDVFAIINAVPAIALLSFGFFNKGLLPGLCFGAGLGITLFGIAYMFVHDGLVHKRFPVGPIASVPYLTRVAAAHQLHHSGKFDGVPYGLFLGPQEVEEVGGLEELEKEISRRTRSYTSS
ncbi:hypothetical protein TSUD_44000 [Trifolium subterraneum]|uniref:beta-carotene 3-hydroxylase n=1 Tax=Trifolium subterraneum TaxID=3900 RepID=A0A2Z6NQX8_TRISU|nr:hypothetical protein TSUD_44000 [Trifolium subterraneum]